MWGKEVDKRYWLLLLLSSIVLLGFPAVFIIAPLTQFSYLELTQAVAPAGSLIFAIILAFLYLNLGIAQERQTELIAKQTDIQDKQNEILERQVSLNRTQFEPDIEVLESSPILSNPDFGVENNLYTVKLANKGEGVANHLNLWCELLYYDGDSFILIDDIRLEMDGRPFNLRPALDSLVSPKQFESDQMRHYGGYLEPGETAEYQAEIGFLGFERGIPAETIIFTDVLQILRENTINNLDIHLWLVYKDHMGQNHFSKVESGHFDVYQTDNLEEAIGGPPGHFQLEDDRMVERIKKLNIEPANVHQRY
ncbi:hypothetical protein [Saliphagus infecundisoli]|uniref:Uncharacterized protein n=1 Tax=Saliphagus infecundisoli TaxID=1849069 RepID=A0ABD5QB63_9EURY|nr:hypothetical protein [Saliphagus infecundisoli]